MRTNVRFRLRCTCTDPICSLTCIDITRAREGAECSRVAGRRTDDGIGPQQLDSEVCAGSCCSRDLINPSTWESDGISKSNVGQSLPSSFVAPSRDSSEEAFDDPETQPREETESVSPCIYPFRRTLFWRGVISDDLGTMC